MTINASRAAAARHRAFADVQAPGTWAQPLAGPATMQAMLNVNKLIPQARGLAAVLLKRASQIELDWDTRQKSRFDTTDSAGRHLGVFLPRGTVVRGGDALLAEDGSLVRVMAAPQPVLVVRHCPQHGSPFDLLRAAYHLGNRHVQLELQADHLKLEPDHVLADMLRAMHLIVSEEDSAFEPEAGAYAQGPASGHGHGHERGHAADPSAAHSHGDEEGPAQDHDHHGHEHHAHEHPVPVHKSRPAPALAPAKPHVHGPGCGHDHGHGHHDHEQGPEHHHHKPGEHRHN